MLKNWMYPTTAVMGVLLLWHFAIPLFGLPAYLLPPPLSVLERLWTDWAFLGHHSWVTSVETLGGFLLSIAVGIPLGILLVWSRPLERAIMPLLVVSQAFPKVAVAPLIIIWFGLGLFPKILIAFSVAFFPIVVSTVAGMRSVDADLNDLARSMRAGAADLSADPAALCAAADLLRPEGRHCLRHGRRGGGGMGRRRKRPGLRAAVRQCQPRHHVAVRRAGRAHAHRPGLLLPGRVFRTLPHSLAHQRAQRRPASV